MTVHIPKPRRIPVGTATGDIGIASDLYMTIVNVGWSPVFVNLSGQAATADRGAGDDIEIPAKGNLPNIPPMGRTKIEAIAESIPSFIILTFSMEPAEIPALAPDNARLTDNFHDTMVNDDVVVLYAQATWAALGGHRKRATVIRAKTNPALVTVDGTTPNRGVPTGIPIQADDSVTIPVDSYSDIQVQNLTVGQNTEVHGFTIGD